MSSLFSRPNLRVVSAPEPRAYPKLGDGPVEISKDPEGRFWLAVRTAGHGETRFTVSAETLRTLIDVATEELEKEDR
jgi:hypothetical protein